MSHCSGVSYCPSPDRGYGVLAGAARAFAEITIRQCCNATRAARPLSRELMRDILKKELTIAELAETVCEVVGFTGSIERDLSKPDGTQRKVNERRQAARSGLAAEHRVCERGWPMPRPPFWRTGTVLLRRQGVRGADYSPPSGDAHGSTAS